MPRYFFHVHDSEEIIDHIGTELANPDEANAQAVTAAGEALRDSDGKFWNSGEWRMRVTDESGATVCSLRFSGERAHRDHGHR